MSTPSHPHLRILLTNDDGIHAEGFLALEAIAREISDDVWIAAPEREQSGASRKMSFTEPVMVHQLGEKRFSVAGTPADAAFLGVHDLVVGRPPDLLLSGVNRGQNLAEDVTVSGTIAAALQAMQLGITSFALSQTLKGILDGSHANFAPARVHGASIVRQLWDQRSPSPVVMNINFPDCAPDAVKGVQVTRQGFRDQWHLTAERRTDLRGRTYYWLGWGGSRSNPVEGDDLHAIYHDFISVTPLGLDLTESEHHCRMQGTLSL
jgi:5'-nucleotidase